MNNNEFLEYLMQVWPGLTTDTYSRIARFRDWVLVENEKQNLTRLTSPHDFVDGHVADVRALFESGLVRFPAMDLGSGGGVPGLLSAVIRPDQWVLVDAEARKADYLVRSAVEFGLESHVRAISGRAEAVLKDHSVNSVVARAVGPVERIYGWLKPCSTWNNLVLLKGPGWEEEWAEFQRSKHRRNLTIDSKFEYSVGPENKKRLIVRLNRVLRGTK